MPNPVHLLIERQADAISRIMHRVLTGFSQYYNRKYRKVGHVEMIFRNLAHFDPGGLIWEPGLMMTWSDRGLLPLKKIEYK